MKTFVVLIAIYLITVTIKKIWGRKLKEIPLLRDMNLSLRGLIGAIGIVILVMAGMNIAAIGSEFYQMASGSSEVVYAQAESDPVKTVLSQYADGSYSGTGYGFRGPITVAVQVAGGEISSVEVTDQQDDRKWFERAYSAVAQEILSVQSANVDTVSGATFSSRGIIDGAAAALEQARAAAQ